MDKLRRTIKKALNIALILIGFAAMFHAWVMLGIGIDALLIKQMHDLGLENTEAWRVAFQGFRHGLDSLRWFHFWIGFSVAVIGSVGLILDSSKLTQKNGPA